MKLFKLYIKEEFIDKPDNDLPYFAPFSAIWGGVVRARNETHARTLMYHQTEGEWWIRENMTTCEIISVEGKAEILLMDQPSG